ncbi:MAG: discoidin domain-containing protein [Bacteroidales bacterium]
MKNILYTALILFTAISCTNEDEGIRPADISNVGSDSLPGQISLHWDMPDSTSIHYVEVSYYDHLKQKTVVHLSSTDTMLISNTRNKYGLYKFQLTPYSINRTPGNTIEHEGMSGHTPITENFLSEEEFSFTEDLIEGNSIQDGTNPPINLFDGDESTMYHSIWRGTPPYPAWLSFDLQEEITAFKLNWGPRTDNSNGKPTDIDLFGSTDGENWFLIINLTKEKDGLPVTTTDWFRSPTYKSSQPFRYLKLSVNDTEGSPAKKFWSMSELEIYKVNLEVINPEDPNYEE